MGLDINLSKRLNRGKYQSSSERLQIDMVEKQIIRFWCLELKKMLR